MFTGIIETLGVVRNVVRQSGGLSLTIEAGTVCSDLEIGHSMAVNGACLTVVHVQDCVFSLQVVEETLATTTLHRVRVGDKVNLERALLSTQRLGGHILTGHIDGIGIVCSRLERGSSTLWSVELPDGLVRYAVRQGSMAVDGVSLTVADLAGRCVVVSIIPHTSEMTTFGFRQVGDEVNIEVDIIGKYVERFMEQKRTGMSETSLHEQGY